MSILLIGCRGCGKTTVGRLLADRLKLAFLDTDEEIVRRTRRTIREIFEDDGEAAFREIEEHVVRDALALHDHVIALGGGAVLSEPIRAAMASSKHPIVYLRADVPILTARILADPETTRNRPNLTDSDGEEECRRLLAVREPIYRSVMTHEIDATFPAERVVELIAAQLGGRANA